MVPADLMRQIDELAIRLREQGVEPEAFRQGCIDEYFQMASKRRQSRLKQMNEEEFSRWCHKVKNIKKDEIINEASFEFDSWPEISHRGQAAANISLPEIDMSI